jgi:hypothetical protein
MSASDPRPDIRRCPWGSPTVKGEAMQPVPMGIDGYERHDYVAELSTVLITE